MRMKDEMEEKYNKTESIKIIKRNNVEYEMRYYESVNPFFENTLEKRYVIYKKGRNGKIEYYGMFYMKNRKNALEIFNFENIKMLKGYTLVSWCKEPIDYPEFIGF